MVGQVIEQANKIPNSSLARGEKEAQSDAALKHDQERTTSKPM